MGVESEPELHVILEETITSKSALKTLTICKKIFRFWNHFQTTTAAKAGRRKGMVSVVDGEVPKQLIDGSARRTFLICAKAFQFWQRIGPDALVTEVVQVQIVEGDAMP